MSASPPRVVQQVTMLTRGVRPWPASSTRRTARKSRGPLRIAGPRGFGFEGRLVIVVVVVVIMMILIIMIVIMIEAGLMPTVSKSFSPGCRGPDFLFSFLPVGRGTAIS